LSPIFLLMFLKCLDEALEYLDNTPVPQA